MSRDQKADPSVRMIAVEIVHWLENKEDDTHSDAILIGETGEDIYDAEVLLPNDLPQRLFYVKTTTVAECIQQIQWRKGILSDETFSLFERTRFGYRRLESNRTINEILYENFLSDIPNTKLFLSRTDFQIAQDELKDEVRLDEAYFQSRRHYLDGYYDCNNITTIYFCALQVIIHYSVESFTKGKDWIQIVQKVLPERVSLLTKISVILL